MFYDYWKDIIDKAYGSDYSVVTFARGTGKTTCFTMAKLYEAYVLDTATKLSKMKRIPRKMKKQYKKNKNIWTMYKRMKTCKGSI